MLVSHCGKESALLVASEQAANVLAKGVELSERLGGARFVNYSGANERVVVIFEDQEEDVILKAEEIAAHKRLADGRSVEAASDFSISLDVVHAEQNVFKATKPVRTDQRDDARAPVVLAATGSGRQRRLRDSELYFREIASGVPQLSESSHAKAQRRKRFS